MTLVPSTDKTQLAEFARFEFQLGWLKDRFGDVQQ